MTDEEKILAALADVEQMRKDVAELKTLDLATAFQTGGPRSRGSSRQVVHGDVVVRVENFVAKDAGFFPLITAPPPEPEYTLGEKGADARLTRTVTPMRSKHQRTMIGRIWKYRNFRKCGTCGGFDTYMAMDKAEYNRSVKNLEKRERPDLIASLKIPTLAATNGIEVWCYQCGSQDEDVTRDYKPDPESKYKQRTCTDCGNEIWATRGELMFPTGDTDPINGRPDYRCEPCNNQIKGEKK